MTEYKIVDDNVLEKFLEIVLRENRMFFGAHIFFIFGVGGMVFGWSW